MAATCAKPTCSDPAVAWLETAPGPRIAYLHDEAVDRASALCARHRDRFTVPAGWRIVRDGEPSSEHHADRRPWFASEVELDADEATVSAAPGSLLSRAFNGPSGPRAVVAPDELEARRLARLERVEAEIDGAPERLRDGIEQHGHDDGDSDGDGDQRADGDVGSSENGPNDDHDEHESEGDDGVDTYGANELPFPPLEPKSTPRAAIG